jgi:xanthine dehydrogenase molybdopterin-binding subunit B
MTYAYGVHIGVVRVDPETGHVAVERFLIAYDIGRAINPNVVPGRNERKSMGGWNPFHTARCCGWRYADLSPIGLGLS